MFTQIALVSAAIIAAYYYLFRKKLNIPPGPTGLPFVGCMFKLGDRPQKAYRKWKEAYGDIFHYKLGGTRVVVLSNLQLIKECFNNPVFSGRPADMMFCILSNGQHGILASEGPEWIAQRRFTLRHLRDFGFGKNLMEGLIMEQVNDFNSVLKADEGKSILINNQKFELPILNALWVILTGKTFRHDDTEKLEMLKRLDEFARPSLAGLVILVAPSLHKIAPGLLQLTHFEDIRNDFHKTLKEIIQEHEETLPEEGNPRDFIDAYLHEMKKTEDTTSSFYKEAGVRSLLAVIGDMFFAGSETSSATLAWSVLYLAMNPETQKKLQNEIDNTVGKSRQVSLADRQKLPYAEATIQEVFRKSSLVVNGLMHTSMEDATFAGYDIPKGTWIQPSIYVIHHDPSIWGDPENFRPERFLSEDGKTVIKSENLIPFSVGKRICLGENLARDEIFLFLTNIFQRFAIELDPSKPRPTYEPKVGFLLHPEDFYVIVKERV
jgi:cytochrome P450